MYCVSCKKQLNIQESPNGAFFCSQKHFQCGECTRRTKDRCCECGTKNNFLTISFAPHANPQEATTSVDTASNQATKGSSCSSITTLNTLLSVANPNEDVPTLKTEKLDEPSGNGNVCDPNEPTSCDLKVDTIYVRDKPTQVSSTDLFECCDSVETCRRVPEVEEFHEDSLKDDEKPAMEHNKSQETSTTTLPGSQYASILDSADSTGLTEDEQCKPACKQTTSPRCSNSCSCVNVAPATHDISVSTQSMLCLADLTIASEQVELPDKCPKLDYQVMKIGATATDFWGSEKLDAQPSIDQRLNKVLGTLQEEACPSMMPEKPLLKELGSKLKESSALPTQLEQTEHSVDETGGMCVGVGSVKHSHVYRAAFKPLSDKRQSEKLTILPILSEEEEEEEENKETPLEAEMPGLSVMCPDTLCGASMFVSDVAPHVMHEHMFVPMERIVAGEHRNFFIEPEIDKGGIMKINMMFLLHDKVEGIGSGKYKDFLPLLVMSTRVSIEELGGQKRSGKSLKEFLLIWMTGNNPSPSPIRICLSALGRSSCDPALTTLTFGNMYSIQKSQALKGILESCNLLLSQGDIKILTNNGGNALELQLLVD